ncbi:late competence development ComFB family protein [Vibrio agarivorans]|uniref:late competence development ComFB family protein n=1 Tax=Vibrio agarivorans TaxID=153622 RepID=UPI0022304355|nr:late competence development ComFB family protein [Vibrio agarivorans]
MKISVDVHNYMETLVGKAFVQMELDQRFNDDQLADIACIALGQLKPLYIRHDIDFLSALAEERLLALTTSTQVAINNAIEFIINDRRLERDASDLPVQYVSRYADDEQELEWFEKPIWSQAKVKQ